MAMSTTRKTDEPYWAPLPRQHFTPAQTAGIVVRHLIPLVGVLWFGWSAGQFLLLSVFNVAFSVACIGVVGVGVSTRRQDGPSKSWADELAFGMSLLAAGAVISLVLTGMFGWVIAVLASDSEHSLFNASLAWSALAMMASAAPALFTQYRADVRSSLSEEDRKKRDQPNVLVLVMCGGLIFIMSGYAADFSLVALAMAVTALFTFRDLRPDLMRELTRPKNMPP